MNVVPSMKNGLLQYGMALHVAASQKDEMLPRDVIKEIAADIGRDTIAYIEVMYPEAIKATSSTFKLSVRNHIFNQIMASVEMSDVAAIRTRLAGRAKWRKEWLATYRRIRKAEK